MGSLSYLTEALARRVPYRQALAWRLHKVLFNVRWINRRLDRNAHLIRLKYQQARRLADRDIAQARTIYVHSWHVHTHGYCSEVEAYVTGRPGPNAPSVAVTVRSLDAFRYEARGQWASGEIAYGSDVQVVVPQTQLTPELVEEALRRWYMTRFGWDENHWAVRQRTLPRFEFDIEWDNPAEGVDLIGPDEAHEMLRPTLEKTAAELRGQFGLQP